MTLIGMIVHGRGDKAFAQYFNEIWPNDPNFMIRSLLRLFPNLEKEPVRELRVLFEFKPQNTFFQQILMQRNSYCLNALKLVNNIVGVKLLL
jgi:hypothetical protein